MPSVLTIDEVTEGAYDRQCLEDFSEIQEPISHCCDCGLNLYGNELACLSCHGEKINDLAEQYHRFRKTSFSADQALKKGNASEAIAFLGAAQKELDRVRSMVMSLEGVSI